MKRLPLVIGLVAVVLFLTTASYINKYMKSLQRKPTTVVERVAVSPVVVAAQDLPIGIKLDARHLRTLDWPEDAVPPNAIADPKSLLGSLTTASFLQNEPLRLAKLAKGDQPGILPLRIPDGMRAVSVRVNDVTGISGFVAPGTKVDIIAVMQTKHVDGGVGAFTLLQDIEVLAIAQDMDARGAEPKVVKTVTVLVTPNQAERLALASNSATLQLALRGYQDRYGVGTGGVSLSQITFGQKGPGRTVELIRGRERIALTF